MWEFSIFGYPGSYTNTRSFNSDALDRLDYFIAKLKENGVYVHLNLLVGRNFLPGDGLPSSINNLDWKQKQVPAMFYQPMIELQKEYATNLLTRLNTYTSTYYNNEPAIAFVEIVNEHGLIQGWLDGTIDILPQEFAEDLRTKWNDWLLNKYQTHSNLLSSGWAIDEPLGPEILKNTDFSQGFLYWGQEVHDVAKASFTIVSGGGYGGSNAVKIVIENTSQTSWHVQFKQSNLVLFSTNVYTLSFYAKADRNISINVQLGMDHDPWNILGFDQLINLTTYYQYFSFQLMPSADDNNARVCFTNMCKELATYYFSNISFKKGGSIGLLEGENLDQKTMQIVKYSERNKRTKIAQKDWVNFLYDLEENYHSVMYNHIKNTIGFKGVVCGTTVGLTSVPNIQSKLDFVDTHSYWYHPVFPGAAWDMNNWYVTNATLVKDINGGTISEIAVKRVYGKPFTISEYNHPSPNTFSSEAYIFLSAFAAYHDWDAIYGYTYLGGRTSFDNRRIEGFFDLNQHPTKFLTFIPAALIYRRGDVSASQDKFWRNNYLTQDGCPQPGMWRVKRPSDGNDTVSEGIGYGMLITVLMTDANDSTKQYFDGLFRYYKYYLGSNGLMHWRIDANGNIIGYNAATDADEDVALALLFAHKQWGSNGAINYLQEAQNIINALYNKCVESGTYVLKPGDVWGGSSVTNPSYFAAGFYRIFANATGNNGWLSVANKCYDITNYFYNSYNTGLVPDWCQANGQQASGYSYDYKYDACRFPWRYGLDYLWYGTTAAYNHLKKLSNWIYSQTGGTPSNIKDGYQLNGNVIGEWNNAAFVGPFTVGAMVDSSLQTWLNSLYSRLASFSSENYYNDSLRILTLLVVTGNFPNLWELATGSISVYIFSPSSGSVFEGSTNVVVNATSSDGVNRVEFYVDNVLKNTDTTSPYSWIFNTTEVSDGGHTIKVVGYSNSGSSATATTWIIVNNLKEAPTIYVSGLTEGTTYQGTVTINVTGEDDIGITKVEFWLGSVLQQTKTSTPYQFSWNTTQFSDG